MGHIQLYLAVKKLKERKRQNSIFALNELANQHTAPSGGGGSREKYDCKNTDSLAKLLDPRGHGIELASVKSIWFSIMKT